MNKKEETKKNYEDFIIANYTKNDIVFVKGQDVWVWDTEGKKYLDFFPGWAVSGLGHCHRRIVKKIQQQAEILLHIPNNYYHPWQGLLGKKLSEKSFGKVFFCNSGAEANEAALKLARLYGREKGKYKIISMENSFHGRTLATLAMTGQEKYHQPFHPLPAGFPYVPFNDFDKLKETVDAETAAVIIELIQGEGGINVVDREYLRKVAELCKKKDMLLIFDEVQTGFGRTGSFFAYQQFGVQPDIMTLAKTLGGGFPVGAMIAKEEISDFLVPGTHAATFGGSPIACAACLGVIEAIEEDNLLENVKEMGKYLREKLNGLQEKYPAVKKIKGIGLMMALELDRECKDLVQICADNGLLLNCTHDNVLRIMPAITVRKQEIDLALKILEDSLNTGLFSKV
jgi:acetylornithine/N-succinyldiaminopimelate aminotransferase